MPILFSGNKASLRGGAFAIEQYSGDLTFQGCIFESNTAENLGGAVMIEQPEEK